MQYLESRYQADIDSGADPKDSKFSLGWALIRSKYRADKLRGIALLEELRFADSMRDRECRYYIAAGYYMLGKYRKAKEYIQPLRIAEPHNAQFTMLGNEIDHAISRGTMTCVDGVDGMIGMALVGGVTAFTVGLLLNYTRNKD